MEMDALGFWLEKDGQDDQQQSPEGKNTLGSKMTNSSSSHICKVLLKKLPQGQFPFSAIYKIANCLKPCVAQ